MIDTTTTTAAQPLDLDKLQKILDLAGPGAQAALIPADVFRAMIAQARTAKPAPDCGACPGDGSICKTECRHRAENPPAGAADTTVSASERALFEAWMKARPGYPFAGAFANLMWDAWRARASLAPVSAQQGAAIPADWCKDCVGQGINTDPPEPEEDDTCPTCNGIGLAAKAPAAQAVPAGFKLVPKEPTQAMCEAARSEAADWQNSGDIWSAMTWLRIYKAMLRASPASTPEAAPTSEDARDAARYRWLRDPTNPDAMRVAANYSREPLDRAIDRAMRPARQDGSK